MAAPTLTLFSGNTVYSGCCSAPLSMASSMFFLFRSSIMSGVSMPAGMDVKPLGVMRPLKKIQAKNEHEQEYNIKGLTHRNCEDRNSKRFQQGLDLNATDQGPTITTHQIPQKSGWNYIHKISCMRQGKITAAINCLRCKKIRVQRVISTALYVN